MRIQPQPGPGIDWAKTSYETPRGLVTCEWRADAGELTIDVVLPEGLPAEIVLPDGTRSEFVGGRRRVVGAAR